MIEQTKKTTYRGKRDTYCMILFAENIKIKQIPRKGKYTNAIQDLRADDCGGQTKECRASFGDYGNILESFGHD